MTLRSPTKETIDMTTVVLMSLMFISLLIAILPPHIFINNRPDDHTTEVDVLKKEVDRLLTLNQELIDLNLQLMRINQDNTTRLGRLMTAVQSIYGEKQKVQNVTIQPPTTKKKTAD